MTSSITRAREIVDTMIANGAEFVFKPTTGALPASFTYVLGGRGSDRWRCRSLVGEAKASPELWRALVAEVGVRFGGDEDVS